MERSARTRTRDRYDAVIAGAGVIGLACAWRASQRGASVLVLDRARPGSGATAVAGGMLAPVGEADFGAEMLLDLGLESARMYPAFVAELERVSGVAVGLRTEGALHVALDRDEGEALRRLADLHRARGLQSEWLGPSAARELEPGLAPSLHGGFFAPADASVDPRQVSRALLAALDEAGVEVRTALIERALVSGDRLEGLVVDGDEVRAGSVVLACGAWSGQVGWLPPEARPPVRPVKGQVVELAGSPEDPVCSRTLGSERVYLVPREDGRVIVGATVEERGFETTVTAGGVLELLREAYRLLPDVGELELVGAVAGFRPATPDNLPLIGPGALQGLLLATGHYRNGILLAPLTAERVAGMLDGAPVAA
ncbi:MAG: glycine oxidase ThiO [Solirubrobacterales bacterium]